jgi:hypothetical protein
MSIVKIVTRTLTDLTLNMTYDDEIVMEKQNLFKDDDCSTAQELTENVLSMLNGCVYLHVLNRAVPISL